MINLSGQSLEGRRALLYGRVLGWSPGAPGPRSEMAPRATRAWGWGRARKRDQILPAPPIQTVPRPHGSEGSPDTRGPLAAGPGQHGR